MKLRLSKKVLIGLVVFMVSFFGAAAIRAMQAPDATQDKTSTRDRDTGQSASPNPQPPQTTVIPAPFNKALFSLDDPTSPWVVVNKKRPLTPSNHVPADLVVPNMRLRANITADEKLVRKYVAAALQEMDQAAKAANITLTLESGYRSYTFQTNLYARYVREQGQAVADTQSARAGHSEHQTGLAADLGGISRPSCNVAECYADTLEGRWVAANAARYGFVIRYPKGQTAVTGYTYEPWHLRYVGKELAAELQKSGTPTLEAYFGLPAAPDYN